MKYLVKILFSMYTALIAFDGVRDTYLIKYPIGYVRDTIPAIIFIIMFCLYPRALNESIKKSTTIILFLIAFSFIYIFIVSLCSSPFDVNERVSDLKSANISILVKLLNLFLLIIVLTIFDKYYNWLNYFSKYFIIWTCVLAFVTFTVAVFIPDEVQIKWPGRVSISYPPSDTILAASSIALISMQNWSKAWRYSITILLSCFIISQFTTTGMLCLMAITLVKIFNCPRKKILAISATTLLSACLIITASNYFGCFDSMSINNGILERKLNSIHYGIDLDPSFLIRKQQIETAIFIFCQSYTNIFFGGGAIGIFAIENGYVGLLVSFGIIGSLFVVSIVIFTFLHLTIKRYFNQCIISLLIAISIAALSLSILYLPSTISIIALFISLSLIGQSNYDKSSICQYVE